MAVNALISLIIGQLFEVWGRKKVLVVSIVILAIGAILPAWAPIDDPKSLLYTISLLTTGIMAEVIMQNPLLNDYVKKHKRGCGAALQELGKELGQIMAFVAFYTEYQYSEDGKSTIFFGYSIAIFVIGLLVCFLLVKEPVIKRDYKKEKNGKLVRQTRKEE